MIFEGFLNFITFWLKNSGPNQQILFPCTFRHLWTSKTPSGSGVGKIVAKNFSVSLKHWNRNRKLRAYQYLNICNMHLIQSLKQLPQYQSFLTDVQKFIYPLVQHREGSIDSLNLNNKHVWEYFLHNFNNFSGFIQRDFLCHYNYNRKFWSYSMWPSKFQKGYKRWVEFSWR